MSHSFSGLSDRNSDMIGYMSLIKKIVFADLQSVPKTAFLHPNRELAHHCEGGKRKSKGTLKFKLQTSYTEQFFFLRQLP